MAMMSASVGRRNPRDSEADVETQIFVRPPMAWDRLMVLQIMRDLEKRPPRVVVAKRNIGRVPPPDEPNVFLTPRTSADPALPWSDLEPARADETLVLEGRPRRSRRSRASSKSRTPWLVFLMAFGIAFGIGQDRQLRRELGTKLRVATSHAAASLVRHLPLSR
ncbi:MAG: hypothetical protein QOI41_1877 [Myxococcales bacterium]|nr:hypothetical protein [Myxococcales bacterium]